MRRADPLCQPGRPHRRILSVDADPIPVDKPSVFLPLGPSFRPVSPIVPASQKIFQKNWTFCKKSICNFEKKGYNG
jgi:hypothetical protein